MRASAVLSISSYHSSGSGECKQALVHPAGNPDTFAASASRISRRQGVLATYWPVDGASSPVCQISPASKKQPRYHERSRSLASPCTLGPQRPDRGSASCNGQREHRLGMQCRRRCGYAGGKRKRFKSFCFGKAKQKLLNRQSQMISPVSPFRDAPQNSNYPRLPAIT